MTLRVKMWDSAMNISYFVVPMAMATHSSTLAWKIPWMEEPGRLQSMGSQRVRHNWATSLLLFTFMHWRRKWQPTPVFLLENPRDGRAWWAAIYGVAQSRTQLKWLSSSMALKTRNLISKWIFFYLRCNICVTIIFGICWNALSFEIVFIIWQILLFTS